MSRHGHNFRGSDLGLNLSNINERGIQNNQNQNRDVNGQQTTNKKYLQNFLNQNLSQSDIYNSNLFDQDNNQVSVSNIGNSNFNSNNLNTPYNHPSQNEKSGYSVGQPSEISPILNGKQSQNYMPKNPQNYGAPVDQSQFMNKRKSSNNTAGSALGLSHLNSGAPDPRKNDNNYACLIIKRMEFYCSKTNLEKHSSYLFTIILLIIYVRNQQQSQKHDKIWIFDKQEQSYVEATRTAQIRIKLPDNTKPDILMMFIDYLDRGKELPDKIDLYIAQNIVTISESLKMRQIQKKFLMEIIMPMLNRENVIFFVKM